MINNETEKGIIENVSINIINTAKNNKNDIALVFSPLEIKKLFNELVTDKQCGMCDFSDITDEEIDDIVNKLNSIPEEYLVEHKVIDEELNYWEIHD